MGAKEVETDETSPDLLEQEIRKLLQVYGVSALEQTIQKVKHEFVATKRHGHEGDEDAQSVGSASTNSSTAQYFHAMQDGTTQSSNILRIQEAMLEASFDAQFAVNEQGKIRHVNRAAVKKFGYSCKEDLEGNNIKMIVGGGHAEHHDSYLQNFKDTRVKKLIGSLREVSGRKKDGTEFPCIIGIEVIQIEHSSAKREDEMLYFACIRDITDQKRAQALQEQALQDQKVRAAILDASFDSMFAIDLDGVVQIVNEAAVTAFGYSSQEELVGMNISVIVGGGHAAAHDTYLRNYKKTGKSSLMGSLREMPARRKDGTEFPVIIGIKRVERDSDTNNPLMVAFVRDITQQKETERLQEQALQDNLVKFAILDASFDSMVSIDLQGTIQMVNQATVDVFGYDFSEDLVGKNVNCIVGGGFASMHDTFLKRYKETGKTHLIGSMREMSARRKDGTEFPVVIGIKRVDRKDKSDPLMVAFIRDITGQKEREKMQEQALEDTQVRLAILDASFDSMVAINLEGTIQMVNQATVDIFGYDSPESLIGENVNCIVGGGFASMHDAFLKRYKETGKTHLIGSMREMSARKKDGTEFPVIIGIKRVDRKNRNDPLMVAFIRDITSRKEAEKLEQKAIQEQRVRSAILDASFDAMFAMNTFGVIQMVNRAAVEQFGYESPEELLGKNIKLIVGGGHAKHHDDYLKQYRETGVTHIIGSMRELQARRKNGKEFPVVLGIERITELDGDESDEDLLVAFVRDITQQKRATELEIEIRSAEELLHNMLPAEIAGRLQADPGHLADSHENASILFADIVGFTAMSSKMSPVDLVLMLNELFTRFDHLVGIYGLNKVKTIGDCYMVTSIPSYQDPDKAAAAMCHFALDMIDALKEFNVDHPENKLDLRVGINTGHVVAGVVGTSRFLYDLWGDAVNLASRMESTGVPSRVQISKHVVENVEKGEFEFEARGSVQMKGKGLVEAFMLKERLKPKEAYFVGPSIVAPTEDTRSDLPSRSSFRGPGRGGRRASTLQGTLMALQASMMELSETSSRSRSVRDSSDCGETTSVH